MNRPLRITVELLGPPCVAAVVYSCVAFVFSRDVIFVEGFFMFLVFAYVFAGIPSFVFTAIMEISFARGLKVRSWRAVLLAAGVGLLSGIVIALTMARGFDNQRGAFSVFPALGLITGSIVAVAVRACSSKNA